MNSPEQKEPLKEVDDGQLWQDYKAEQKERRAKRLPIRTQEILYLEQYGFRVRTLTQYHFRVNDVLDLYPIHRCYHYIPKNKRGDYRDALAITRKWCSSQPQVDEKKRVKNRHRMLHGYLDELAAIYVGKTGKTLSETTVMNLIEWSHEQTKQ